MSCWQVVRSLLFGFVLLTGACRGTRSEPALITSGDSCALTRPAFVPALAAERSIFAYDVSAPINLQAEVESTQNDIELRAISFDSPAGGRATGFMLVPVTRSSLRPGLILQHGMPARARDVILDGLALAGHGAVVIALDAPFARRTGSAVRFTPQDSAEQVQLMQDLQRAVDILRAQVNVDPNRIAYVGISYGGAMGALFAGVERRLKAAVLVVGDGGLISHFTGLEDESGFLASVSCATRVRWLRAMTPIEPIRFVGLAAPLPLLMQSGRSDVQVPPDDAHALHDAAAQPKTVKWYDAAHGLNAQAARDRLDWLHQQIGTDVPRF